MNMNADIDKTAADIINIASDAPRGCALEIDGDIPEELHEFLADYPPAAEKRSITYVMLSPKQRELLGAFNANAESYGSTEKLVPNLENKRHYVVHYRTLQRYLKLGFKLTKVHRMLEFDQSPWLKPYIDFNTEQRTRASNEFEKDFFKLMNNAMFGKTMENLRNRRNIELATERNRIIKLAARPTFRSKTIISDDLTAVENYKTSVTLDKPIYVGFAVLELSKDLMFDFHYGYIKRKYPGDQSTLLFTDTDSLAYSIRTSDVYADMLADAYEPKWSTFAPTDPIFAGKTSNEVQELRTRTHDWFDWSGYPATHPVFADMNCAPATKR